jgi:hypothetical protein
VRMTIRRRGKLSVNRDTMSAPATGDDTVELQLTAEQMQELSRAAELAESVEPAQVSAFGAPGRLSSAFTAPQPPPAHGPASPAHPWRPVPLAKMAAALAGYVVLAWWSASQLAGQPQPTVAAAVRPAVIGPRPALVADSPKPALRVVNPFDVTEVFEFPAGTSTAEGHAKVAQVLLQRARERQSQWEHIKPLASLRTASLYRSGKTSPLQLSNPLP